MFCILQREMVILSCYYLLSLVVITYRIQIANHSCFLQVSIVNKKVINEEIDGNHAEKNLMKHRHNLDENMI